MAHEISPDYNQQFLLPPALEDWVSADHPARFIREFVDQMNLSQLGFSQPAAKEGRPRYAPSLLLKIWLYGYFFRIRSTRKLEAACQENLGLLWLTGLIQPDHNSLWRFWDQNKKAIRAVFKQTVQVAVRTGCTGLALQALDGTKLEAAACSHHGWSKEYMEQVLQQLDKALDQVELKVLEENTSAPANEHRLPAGLAQRQALREQIKAGLAQIQADERKHYHPVEPEARRMKVAQNNRYAYNAQAIADSKEGIVVACEVVREETDHEQLVPMIEQARQNVGVAGWNTVTVADSGYGSGADLKAAEDKGLAVLAPPLEGKPAKDNPYASQHFSFDEAKQTVTCPEGKVLDYEGHTTKKGLVVQRYRCHCKTCPVRSQCSKDPKGRQIEIWPHTPQVQAMRDKLATSAGRELWKQRRELIERCFGQIKQHDGFRRWSVWGLEGVRTQWSMICTTLNLRVLYKRWCQEPSRMLRAQSQVAVVWKSLAGGWKRFFGFSCTRSLVADRGVSFAV